MRERGRREKREERICMNEFFVLTDLCGFMLNDVSEFDSFHHSRGCI